jgi:mRNA interferase MazF
MRRGDVVLIAWPFTDFIATKVRPAVVLSSDAFNQGEDRILVAVSSNASGPDSWDVIVQPEDSGFSRTGLHRASTIQCGKLLTVSKNIIKRRLGAAGDYMSQIEAGVRRALALS